MLLGQWLSDSGETTLSEHAADAFARLSAGKEMADRDAFNFLATVFWVFHINLVPRRGASYTPLTTHFATLLDG